jgi:hypothetical protein
MDLIIESLLSKLTNISPSQHISLNGQISDAITGHQHVIASGIVNQNHSNLDNDI